MVALAASRLGVFGSMAGQFSCAALKSSDEGALPAFDGATEWLNTSPLTSAGLRGKVVLIQFWTYTCINWLRTEPYLRAWAERYGRHGLVVIGVHSPEFAFERDVARVRHFAKELRVDYPIAVDSDHTIWRAFDNAYWPALYLADAKGMLRDHHFGEGRYDESERMIQRLLTAAGKRGDDERLTAVDARGVEAAADWSSLRSSENYLGYERTRNFASPGGAKNAERSTYAVPTILRLDEWALAGAWTIHGKDIVLDAAPGRIVYQFHARDLHLVMGPSASDAPVHFSVRLDGQPPGEARGLDVDADGNGSVEEHRLYQLIRQRQPVTERRFEIEFSGPGMEAFAFTFG